MVRAGKGHSADFRDPGNPTQIDPDAVRNCERVNPISLTKYLNEMMPVEEDWLEMDDRIPEVVEL